MMNSNSRSIILAEDNDDDAFLTTRAIESAGISHAIRHFRDGQAVIDYLELLLATPRMADDSTLPDIVLLDLKMPRLGGLQALEWIRRNNVFKSFIVIALTSSSEARDVKAAYDLHVNAYLVKPSSLTEMIDLARAIRHFWLDQDHLVRPPFAMPFSASPLG